MWILGLKDQTAVSRLSGSFVDITNCASLFPMELNLTK